MTGQEFAQKFGPKLLAISHELRKIRDAMDKDQVAESPATEIKEKATQAQGKIAEAIMASVGVLPPK